MTSAPVRFDFSGASVFVAGGTSGINLGIARRFAEAGAKVAVMSRSQDKVDAAVAILKEAGAGAAAGFAADVRDSDAVDAALKAAAEAHGPFNAVVSGAAGNFPAPAADLSPNGFKSVMDIDVLGTFHVMKAAYAYAEKPGAAFINISAPQTFAPMQMQAHVCAAKAGVDMITRVLAMEWGPEGVRVNSIVPGPIKDTEGMDRLAPGDELKEMIVETVPLKRFGGAEEVGDAALFLASPAAAYISGVVLPVDGGWSLSGAGVSTEKIIAYFKGA
ncbi:MAG: SDR family oxidoreductase [Pseudomonadota bacterium]